MNKPKLLGTGNEDGRIFYIIEKKQEFFPLFSKFLINCDLTDNIFLEEYELKVPDIMKWVDYLYHFKNSSYDIDLIFTKEKIILIIRAEEDNLEILRKNINNLCKY